MSDKNLKIKYKALSLTDNLISLENAKKLADLGLRQHSFYYYVAQSDQRRFDIYSKVEKSRMRYMRAVSAYSVEELILMIPEYATLYDEEYFLDIHRSGDNWTAMYLSMSDKAEDAYRHDCSKLTDALSGVLECLIIAEVVTV